MPDVKAANRVDIEDPSTPWAKVVLDAAEALAGRPMEIRGPQGHEYFLTPTPVLASLCRKWLHSKSDARNYAAGRIRGAG